MLKFQTNYTTTIQNFEDFILVVFVLMLLFSHLLILCQKG